MNTTPIALCIRRTDDDNIELRKAYPVLAPVANETGFLRIVDESGEDYLIENQQRRHGLQLLPVAPKHIYALGNLPHHHKAPFDNLLIAQAMIEMLPFASTDSAFSSYTVSRVW